MAARNDSEAVVPTDPKLPPQEAERSRSQQLSVDEDVAETYHDSLKGTRNDWSDMSRMGKIQELRVCHVPSLSCCC